MFWGFVSFLKIMRTTRAFVFSIPMNDKKKNIETTSTSFVLLYLLKIAYQYRDLLTGKGNF
jgi:hypothetical protein